MDASPHSGTNDLLKHLQKGGYATTKVDIARDLLCSPTHVIPRKSTVLLEWALNALIKSSQIADKNKAQAENITQGLGLQPIPESNIQP